MFSQRLVAHNASFELVVIALVKLENLKAIHNKISTVFLITYFFFRFLDKLRELPPELSDKKFLLLTVSAKVSKFNKEEFAAEINAEIAKNVSKSLSERNREFAKKLKARNRPVEEIVEDTGPTEEEVKAL